MDKFYNKPSLTSGRNPWFSFLILILLVFAGLFIGQFFGVLVILPLFDFDIFRTQSILENLFENPEYKLPVLILQAFSALGAFIVAPMVYLYLVAKKPLSGFFHNQRILFIPLLLTTFIILLFMSVNTVFIEWNANLTLPDFLEPLEKWAMEKELFAKELTMFLTDFDNTGQFLLGLIVIALIPAVGEELLFRGLIQNQLFGITKNIHAAIWIAAFLFSAFHLQFYGLVPRMLLGVLFGYLYYWSDNLLIPMMGHFVNNGFTLTMFYLYQMKHIEYDIENPGAIPIGTVLFSLVLGAALLYYFKYFFRHRKTAL